MARRTSRKKTQTNPMPMIVGAIIAIVLAAAAYMFLNGGEKMKEFNELPLEKFLHNPDSLRGSQFSVTGIVLSNLSYSEVHGRTITVEVQKGQAPIAIKVPASVTGPNINIQQTYIFNGTVKPNGTFEVSAYQDK